MIFEDFKRKLKEQIIRQNQKKDAMVFDRFNLAIDKYVKNLTYGSKRKSGKEVSFMIFCR